MHTITLQDGTVLSNLTLNGNNYISDVLIDSAVFVDNLATVEISDGKETQVFEDMKLIANQTHDGKSWIILAEKTAQDKMVERLGKIESEVMPEVLKLRQELETTQDVLILNDIITEAEKAYIKEPIVEDEPAVKE